MSEKILMPALSPTMKEGIINKWLVKVGDKIKCGDVIAEIETDKATMEVEAVEEGIITHLLEVKPNQSIPVNNVIAIIDGNKDDQILKVTEKNENIKFEKNIESSLKYREDFKVNKSEKNKYNIIASKFVKSYAKKNSINLEKIKGSGPNSRIIKRDVINLDSREQVSKILKEYKIIDPSNIRSIIAKRTQDSKQQIPHFYLTIESRADKLINLRNKINEDLNIKVSFNDIIIKALALAMKKNININASWIEGKIYKYSSIDISVAVALEEGLITPIIKDADKKGIKEISLEIKDLIKKAKQNNLSQEEYTGGSISVSNLGMYGIREFSAIINPPQSSILAIGAIKEVPIVDRGIIQKGYSFKSTLSSDHRVLDGAVSAKLLKDFNDLIEDPYNIWLKSEDLHLI